MNRQDEVQLLRISVQKVLRRDLREVRAALKATRAELAETKRQLDDLQQQQRKAGT